MIARHALLILVLLGAATLPGCVALVGAGAAVGADALAEQNSGGDGLF